jgi:Tfp pilus assembly protein PilX
MDRLMSAPNGVRNERGAALPMALFALVALSVLVTSALLTASTEMALSAAQQEATRGLFAADAALERFVAERAALENAETGSSDQVTVGEYMVAGPEGAAFHVSVGALGRTSILTRPDVIEAREVFSIIATPVDGWGRSVGAMVEAARRVELGAIVPDAPMILGGGALIDSDVTIGNTSSGPAPCDSLVTSSAIRFAGDAPVTVTPGATIVGGMQADTSAAHDVVSRMLGDHTIADLAAHATIRFGARFGEPPVSGQASQWAGDPARRWGCPASILSTCLPEQREHLPIIAIDAGGGAVDITGEHGQGVLIVLGDLNIRSDFDFSGILLVDGALTITGRVRIEGAVAATGGEPDVSPAVSRISGPGSVIRFNACRVREVERSLAMQVLDDAPLRIASGTFGWFEVVR